jgi:hypothetical protein
MKYRRSRKLIDRNEKERYSYKHDNHLYDIRSKKESVIDYRRNREEVEKK